MRRRALVVANETYADAQFPNLPAVAADADALERVLADPEVGEFDVEVLHDESHVTVKKAVEGLFRTASSDDLLLLHFSCHGIKAPNQRLHFVCHDTESGYLASTAIEADFVNDQMAQSRARQILLWLDCCFSGAYSRGFKSRSDQSVRIEDAFGRGHLVMTASTSLQLAYEPTVPIVAGAVVNRPSLFTGAIVAGLESGEAGQPDRPRISMNDLYQYVYRRVREQRPDQTPTLSGDKTQGEVYVARNRHAIPAPDSLQRRTDEVYGFSYLVPADWVEVQHPAFDSRLFG